MKVVRLSVLRTGRLYPPRIYSWYSFLLVRPEGLRQWKIPVTPTGIEPATFRLVSQCLNKMRHRVPPKQGCSRNVKRKAVLHDDSSGTAVALHLLAPPFVTRPLELRQETLTFPHRSSWKDAVGRHSLHVPHMTKVTAHADVGADKNSIT